jgi:hypothetical protein
VLPGFFATEHGANTAKVSAGVSTKSGATADGLTKGEIWKTSFR